MGQNLWTSLHFLMHLFLKTFHGTLIIFAGWDPKQEILKPVFCFFLLSFFYVLCFIFFIIFFFRYSLFTTSNINHLTLFSFNHFSSSPSSLYYKSKKPQHSFCSFDKKTCRRWLMCKKATMEKSSIKDFSKIRKHHSEHNNKLDLLPFLFEDQICKLCNLNT